MNGRKFAISSISYMMLKKGQLTKQLKEVQKKPHCLGRVMEGLFLSHAGPKRGCLSYLTNIREICYTSDVYLLIITIRYDKHPLFGPALDKNKHSITRRKQWFFFGLKWVDLFLSITFNIRIILYRSSPPSENFGHFQGGGDLYKIQNRAAPAAGFYLVDFTLKIIYRIL